MLLRWLLCETSSLLRRKASLPRLVPSGPCQKSCHLLLCGFVHEVLWGIALTQRTPSGHHEAPCREPSEQSSEHSDRKLLHSLHFSNLDQLFYIIWSSQQSCEFGGRYPILESDGLPKIRFSNFLELERSVSKEEMVSVETLPSPARKGVFNAPSQFCVYGKILLKLQLGAGWLEHALHDVTVRKYFRS